MYVQCPVCHSREFIKYGFIRKTIPRYKCNLCNGQFTLTNRKEKYLEKKYMALQMFLNGGGYRMIARELQVSDTTVKRWVAKYQTDIPSFQHRADKKGV